MAGPVDWPVSAHSNSNWVTPFRISPKTCTKLSLLGSSLSLCWIGSADVPLCLLLVSAVSRSASHEVEMYFLPPCFRLILTMCYCFFREQDIASGRSPESNQADPFHAQTRLAKLYDFAPDIQDAMELRALGPHTKLVKVISVWKSMGSRMIIPNDLAPCGVHEFLLHSVGEGELLFMMTGELDYIGRV